jgi:hypothetical protein
MVRLGRAVLVQQQVDQAGQLVELGAEAVERRLGAGRRLACQLALHAVQPQGQAGESIAQRSGEMGRREFTPARPKGVVELEKAFLYFLKKDADVRRRVHAKAHLGALDRHNLDGCSDGGNQQSLVQPSRKH